MEFQEIKVTIGKDGAVQLDVNGVKGMSCLDLTRALEEALGGEVGEREMKPDAYEQDQHLDQREHLRDG